MARIKKAIDYINELCESKNEKQRALGETLRAQYKRWTETLTLEDFLKFSETIMENKAEIGAAQFFGKFRAYAFEEYIYRILKAKIHIEKPLEIFWAEKCLVWREKGKEYAMEFDVSIGTCKGELVDPMIVLDAKVELDSSRLKTAIASFAILKKWKPEAKCIVAYVKRELDDNLLKLARNWADGVFQFSLENNETEAFLIFVAKCVPSGV
ncbi:MAG: hypothetical protein QXD34_00655 [Candidatus Bathyarchaeia archaeon]